jgi:hypothetical protein
MSQSITYQEAEHARVNQSNRNWQRSGNCSMTLLPRAARGREPAVQGEVPALDWPRDLFDDNASTDELVAVDFLMQCDSFGNRTTH